MKLKPKIPPVKRVPQDGFDRAAAFFMGLFIIITIGGIITMVAVLYRDYGTTFLIVVGAIPPAVILIYLIGRAVWMRTEASSTDVGGHGY